ncbi:SGNH/GDSL hydrolase family protein [Streptomyces sp. PTM05]|uniref:SGNH/GDSL hydrolase family protein n=1 Tax=Streptantibioticus parmotrematis TaxID=2873249 RepID=A0ABS7QYB4_9ACTN|nr:SGNH/GDSL hydrolase family protein [Streptantibioticus parmotrematis]MBY8887913.1 SGNH/GDSL hydrolase family protein [Streptantibioticus parmotrematis]
MRETPRPRRERHRPARAVRRRRAGLVAAVCAALLVVAGCGPSGRPAASGSPSPSGPVWNPRPSSVAALGDSITRGFDACSLLSDCPDVSWSTGDRSDVDSLATRLLASPAGRTWNFAVSGARVDTLVDQAREAAAKRPGLATILIGANDACADSAAAMTPVADFRARFTDALRTLHGGSPHTEVYVASVPDLYRLWSVGRSSVLGRSVWNLGICPSMLADPMGSTAADTTRRDAVRARVAAYDQVLQQVCGQYPLCRYDGGAVHDEPFTTAELSPWDWFHPSTKGQAELARIAYAGVTRK